MLQRQSDGVWFVIGCHPKSATEFAHFHKHGLRDLLSKTVNVVALGCIGLDYSSGSVVIILYTTQIPPPRIFLKMLEIVARY